MKTKLLPVGTLVNQQLDIPVFEMGQGKKKIAVVGGVHGNEPESLFIIREVLNLLSGKKLSVKLKILPGVNGMALINNTRVGAFDGKDLNRSFPGNMKGTLTDRIAAIIFNEVKSCDVVIDIHTVINEGDFMGMFLANAKKREQLKTENAVRLMKPPIIWKVGGSISSGGALDEALLEMGVCGIGIEVPRLGLLDSKTLSHISEGIAKIIMNPDLNKAPKLSTPIPILGSINRHQSDIGGIYTPVAGLMSPIKKGQIIGLITDLRTMKDIPQVSEQNGILFVQSTQKVVRTGDKIFVIAQKEGELV